MVKIENENMSNRDLILHLDGGDVETLLMICRFNTSIPKLFNQDRGIVVESFLNRVRHVLEPVE